MRWLGLCAVLCAVGCDGESQPVTYDRVAQVFADNGCTAATCHSEAGFAGDLNLEGAAGTDELVDVPCSNPSADASGIIRVKPGSPEASFLLIKLELDRNDARLGNPMPPAGEPLTDSDIDLVRDWIEAGAQ